MRPKYKKLLSFLSVIIVLLIAYLFLANARIYKIIGSASLPSPDTKHEYTILGSPDKTNTVIYTALGDSLTAGVGTTNYEQSYPYIFAEKISTGSKSLTLYDRAYPGARTSDVIKNLLSTAITDQPDVVTVLVGANDIHDHTSEKEFSQNYQYILTQLKTKTKAKIFAVSIPYLGTNNLLLPPYNTYFKNRTVKFNLIIKKLAEENNIKYIDLYTPTENFFDDPTMHAADFFHPTAKAYNLWAKIIYANYNK